MSKKKLVCPVTDQSNEALMNAWNEYVKKYLITAQMSKDSMKRTKFDVIHNVYEDDINFGRIFDHASYYECNVIKYDYICTCHTYLPLDKVLMILQSDIRLLSILTECDVIINTDYESRFLSDTCICITFAHKRLNDNAQDHTKVTIINEHFESRNSFSIRPVVDFQ